MTPGWVFLTGADIVILAVCVVGCLDYARRWWKGRQEAKGHTWRMKNGGRIAWSKPERPDEWCGSDFPRPMGAAGYIKESRFTLYAESEAEAIAKLTGEAE